MPGLHLLIQMEDNVLGSQSNQKKFKTILKKMRHYPRYIIKSIVYSEKVMLGFSGYLGYPLKIWQSGYRTIVLEGKIYNREDKEIVDLLFKIPLEPKYLEKKLKEFILNSDGEYIIHVYDKEKNFYFLFNDGLGRLPLYYYSSLHRIIISKEIKFIIPFLNKVVFDKYALAEYLLFLFPLGKHTLLKNIHRLSPATLLLIDIGKKSFTNKVLISWNLDSINMKNVELNNIADNLSTIFLNSLKNRINSFPGYTPLVSLSGGYDSRSVLAGLSKIKANPIARTYINKQSRGDVIISQKISNILNIKQKIISVPSHDEFKLEDMQKLAYLKDGLIYVSSTHMLNFYSEIIDELGTEILGFTGDGGDLTLAPFDFNMEARRFRRKINSSKRLSTVLCLVYQYFSLKEVGQILNIETKKLKKHIDDHVSSYPEQTLEGRFKHFKTFETGFKWIAEGESKNRFFYWHTTPFYSIPFLIEVMKLPQVVKKNRILYILFLSKLDSACAQVNNPISYRRLITNKLMQLSVSKLDIFFEIIGNFFIKKQKRNEEGIDHIRTICLEHLGRSKIASNYIDIKQTKLIIQKEKSLINLFTLLSLLLYIKIIESALLP